MDKQDLFRIFDACQPTVAQVTEYLERISGKSPFRLIFVKDGKEKTTKTIEKGLGVLSGVIIEDTVFYTKVMTKQDADENQQLTANDVFEFGCRCINQGARPLRKADILLLGKHREAYNSLLDRLSFFGYSAPILQDYYLKLNLPGAYTSCANCDLTGYSDGHPSIANFLHFHDIIFCSERKTVSI